MQLLKWAHLSTAMLELFSTLAIAALALYLGCGLLSLLPEQFSFALTVAQVLFILLLTPEFYLQLLRLANDYHARQKALTAADNLVPIMSQALPSAASMPLAKQQDFAQLRLVNVGLTLAKQPVLRAANVVIKRGELVWLRGASGSGKTSLLQLLAGLEHQYTGNFLINDLPLATYGISHWQRQITWLPQQPRWLAASIADNVTLQQPVTSDEVWQVLELAAAAEFVAVLPQGLATPISELGQGLSGGQLQRIALARALFAKTDFWLLDEPVAHLSDDIVAKFWHILKDVLAGKTVIIASHNTHPVPFAHRQLVLDHGQLYAS